MANFDAAISTVLENEGGLVDNPDDPGGLTNFGISQRAYPNLNIRNLTREAASEIYRRDFWRYDRIDSQPVATKLFDTHVNLGPVRAVSMMQRVVGVNPVDGRYGPLTEGVINNSDPLETLQAYRQKLVDYYNNLAASRPTLQQFLKGWLRRANQ